MRIPPSPRERLEKSIRNERRNFYFQGGGSIFYACFTVLQAWAFLQHPDWTWITFATNFGVTCLFVFNARRSLDRLIQYDDLRKRWERS
jgi:hypothetical protein